MTPPRQVIPGRTYLLTRRCTQRQMLLRPGKDIDEMFLYCLGIAAQRYGASIVGFEAMSNHYHVMIRDNRGNYPDFLRFFNKLLASCGNAIRGRWENFFSSEQANVVHLVEAADRFDKLIYLLANPVAADLVEHVRDWPGASSYGLHLTGRSITVKRPRKYFRPDGKMPEEVMIQLERPEGFESLSREEWVERIEVAIRAAEQRAREVRLEKGVSVLGRKAVLRVSPTDTPSSIAPRRRLHPTVACLNPELRKDILRDLLAFRTARRAALVRVMKGEHDVVFPIGTYRIPGFLRTADSPPPNDSLAA